MRRILVENARRKAGPKASGNRERVEFATVEPAIEDQQYVDVPAGPFVQLRQYSARFLRAAYRRRAPLRGTVVGCTRS